MTKAPKPPPTSYALLGLLARGPRSAYELNGIMQTSLIRVYWPRAESHVYSEPKKLLAHGLVSEQREKVNGRPRTVYTITDKGRQILEEWLREESGAELRTQSELMLKLILGDTGDPENARATLRQSLEASRADLQEAIEGIRQIVEHPEYARDGMPWNGLAINLMADTLIARYQWSKYALDAAGSLDAASPDQENASAGMAAYQRALEKMRQALD
jgi:DNA-binding PadR family transcriptional regulator